MPMKFSSVFSIPALIFGFMLFALPEDSLAGRGPIRIDCCQLESSCFTIGDSPFACAVEDVVVGSVCDEGINQCVPLGPLGSIPTLSEWGLIAMAGLIGIAGFLVIRRKRAAA